MNATLALRGKETLLAPNLKDAVRHRETLNDDELASYIEGAVFTLRMVAPLVEEMKRRFQNLDKSKQVNGTYKTIRGCRNFQDYCRTVLHRTEQAVYLMLRSDDAKPKLPKSEPKPKPIKEYKALADAIPPIRNGKEFTKPSEYSAADVVETVTRFTDNLLGQRQFSVADKKTAYRSIILEFQTIITEMES
jgi:hypothetical protein